MTLSVIVKGKRQCVWCGEYPGMWEEQEGDKRGWGGMNQTGNLYENRDVVYRVSGRWYGYSEYWLNGFLLASRLV